MVAEMADYLTEQGELLLPLHENGECGSFGPCPYCEEDEAAEASPTVEPKET